MSEQQGRIELVTLERSVQLTEQLGIPAILADRNIFRLLLRRPTLAKAVNELLYSLLYGAALDDRLRELVIMRIAWVSGSDYEWTQHYGVAVRAFGCTEEDLAAVLSLLCSEVYSIERLRGLHDKARDNLRPFRLANLHLILGDGMVGYAKGAPYAGIIAAAGGEALPPAWIDQLAVGGRVVAPVSAGAISPAGQALVVLEKTAQGLRQTVMEAVHFVPLKSGVVR